MYLSRNDIFFRNHKKLLQQCLYSYQLELTWHSGPTMFECRARGPNLQTSLSRYSRCNDLWLSNSPSLHRRWAGMWQSSITGMCYMWWGTGSACTGWSDHHPQPSSRPLANRGTTIHPVQTWWMCSTCPTTTFEPIAPLDDRVCIQSGRGVDNCDL